MCDVHLIETRRETRTNVRCACGYCGEAITGTCTYIVGTLDDGSPGEYAFAYHAECVLDMEFDAETIAEHDGCFSYGSPMSGTPLSPVAMSMAD
jgi:hypothetical protein